ncbi:flagellar hook assembly protein FlgD [Thioalkalivibrio sp. XN279]|uniref:flagellar hook assembly protein FlgD n=1 Tax=Thioalkalivibrio sp. XN279 TaxID=2714953 RepID=UPI001409B816|nr:flagellar hook assembly protein FlgD [Thioalkalivibrio sp. XN279]NHA13385.1 flagellar hook assembly protein FlgD [Thioalkalivibrio sp. XN279]
MSTIDTNTLEQAGLLRQPKAEPKQGQLGQEQFLELMVTQLRNQDPFKPLESGEFLGQLAQFGTVSGIEDMQQSLKELAGSLTSNQALQAASLVGRQVYVPAQEAWLPPAGTVTGAVDNPEGARDVVVGVYDFAGRLVTTVAAAGSGPQANFHWDGTDAQGEPAAPGFYQLRAVGRQGDTSLSLDTLVRGGVESVSIDRYTGGLSLTVTGLGEVDLGKVRQIG